MKTYIKNIYNIDKIKKLTDKSYGLYNLNEILILKINECAKTINKIIDVLNSHIK